MSLNFSDNDIIFLKSKAVNISTFRHPDEFSKDLKNVKKSSKNWIELLTGEKFNEIKGAKDLDKGTYKTVKLELKKVSHVGDKYKFATDKLTFNLIIDKNGDISMSNGTAFGKVDTQ